MVRLGGIATTVSVAVDVFPVPLVEFTVTLLVCVPTLMPVTFTEKVHDALAFSVAPDKLTALDPLMAVIVPPPQLPLRPLGVATTISAGNVSVKAIPVSWPAGFGFMIVKFRLVVPPSGIVPALNDFVIVGTVS